MKICHKNIEFSLFPKSKIISLVKKSSNKFSGLFENNLYKYINEEEKKYEIHFISEKKCNDYRQLKIYHQVKNFMIN